MYFKGIGKCQAAAQIYGKNSQQLSGIFLYFFKPVPFNAGY